MARTTVGIPTRVLVLGMTHEDGTIVASELAPVAEAVGQTPEQVRSCLRRLVNEGLFVREGSGPHARYRATRRGHAALGWTLERTRLAYAQDAAGRGWDRQWRLVAFAVPERHRSARDAFRDRLVALGGAAVQGGLYVSPHPWLDDVASEAKRLRLEDVEPRVPEMLASVKKRRERLPDSAFLPGALEMAVEFQRVFFVDPLLPPELLPLPWPGRAARDLLVRSRRLALSVQESAGARALFRLYDDAVEALP